MVASPEHPELFVEKKKMLKKVWSYTVDFCIRFVTILHRECYRTLRYISCEISIEHPIMWGSLCSPNHAKFRLNTPQCGARFARPITLLTCAHG